MVKGNYMLIGYQKLNHSFQYREAVTRKELKSCPFLPICFSKAQGTKCKNLIKAQTHLKGKLRVSSVSYHIQFYRNREKAGITKEAIVIVEDEKDDPEVCAAAIPDAGIPNELCFSMTGHETITPAFRYTGFSLRFSPAVCNKPYF